MPSFNKFFTSVYLAVVYASLTNVVPSPLSPDHSTHRVRHIGRDLKIESYHPPSSFEVRRFSVAPSPKAHAAGGVGLWKGLPQPASFGASASGLNDAAIAFVQGRLGVDCSTVGYKSGSTAAAEKFAYVRQTHVCTLTICLSFIVSVDTSSGI